MKKQTTTEKITEILNNHSATDLDWMAQFNGKDCKVIDFMDYHKVASEIAILIDKRAAIIEALEEIQQLEHGKFEDLLTRAVKDRELRQRIQQLKSEI